jgi:ribosomal protein L30/L7E
VRGGGGWADGNKRIETHRLVLNSLGLHAGLRCYALDDAEIEMQMLMLMLMETCALMQGGRSRISSAGGGGWAGENPDTENETHRIILNLLGLHAGLKSSARIATCGDRTDPDAKKSCQHSRQGAVPQVREPWVDGNIYRSRRP